MSRFKALIPFLLLVLFSVTLGYYLSDFEQGDINQYQSIIESSSPQITDEDSKQTGSQKRYNVRKTVVVTEDAGRLMMTLVGKESDLAFVHDDEDPKVVETLKDVECDMQEEVYYILPDGREGVRKPNGHVLVKQGDPDNPNDWFDPYDSRLKPYQRIRHLEADSAVYHYGDDLFVAERVDLDRFETEGHRLFVGSNENIGRTPLMKGFASSVQFSIGKRSMLFRAYRLKAKLYSEGGLF